jgi:hypothetical protein
VHRAQILLKTDTDGPSWTDAKIADADAKVGAGIGILLSTVGASTTKSNVSWLISESSWITIPR